MDNISQEKNTTQLVFARWRGGYFYPAVILDQFDNIVRVNYLDGHDGNVPRDHVMSIEDGLNSLEFQGDWKYFGWYYKGKLNKENMTMYYNDGDVELVEIKQLRGRPPGESGAGNAIARIVVAGVFVVVVAGAIYKALKGIKSGNQSTLIETSDKPLIIDQIDNE